MSECSKALENIRISEKNLPTAEPYKSWTVNSRKIKMRNSLIVSKFIEAAEDKKEDTKALLCEKYGLTAGRIDTILEKGKVAGAIVPALAAKVEVLRRFKRQEVLEDFSAYRTVLEDELEMLQGRLDNDEKWVDVEEIESTGGKFEGSRIKRVTIRSEIRRVAAELATSHKPEADALGNYDVRPGDADGAVVAGKANAAFLDQFNRLQKNRDKSDEIEAEVEIIDD